MAKKTHLKVRLVPESNPDSKFIYYAKNRPKVKKPKINSNYENITPTQESMSFLLKRNYHLTVSN